MTNDLTVDQGSYGTAWTDDTEFAAPRRGHHGGHGHHQQYSDILRFAAEALGTFMLVLAILTSLAFTVLSGGQWLVVALTVGMMLAAAMAAVGHVTGGGDFNPAVTLGKAIAGRLAWRHVLPHIFGQIVGAALAALVTWAILPHAFAELAGYGTREALLGTTAPGYGALSPLSQASNGQINISWSVALLVEIIFTALFVAVVLGATRKRARRSGIAPLIVGMAFAALWLMIWPLTRGGLNPVRAFSSVMLARDIEMWRQRPLFVLGPLIGGALAGLFYRAFHPGHGSDALALNYQNRGYTVNDVADPVYTATAAPVIDEPAGDYYPASTDAVDNEILVSEPVENYVVTEGEVDEGGDRIIFGRDAETVADILEADQER